MLVAVEGCMHGELEKVYDTIAIIEEKEKVKLDLLLCCGDFQSLRNLADLKCMSVPDKYKDIGTFYKYYSGEKTAPLLTIFIGGNHEASNYLQELPFGGWVAPNIYYLGYAGVVDVNGLRIGGVSGIYKGGDYLKGRYEKSPYNNDTIRSVYHTRNIDIFRLRQLSDDPPDIMLSHDWPLGVHRHGDQERLLRTKPFFRDNIANDELGSRATQQLLNALQPRYWFSAHLHVKFAAVIHHDDEKTTKFLSLDKCLPKRSFLQVVEMQGAEVKGEQQEVRIRHDRKWLAILKSTNHLTTVDSTYNHLPDSNYNAAGSERWDFRPTEEDLEKVASLELEVPLNFTQTAEPFNSARESIRQLPQVRLPESRLNPQTRTFCDMLKIDDPLALVLGTKRHVNEPEKSPPKRTCLDLSSVLPTPRNSDAAAVIPDVDDSFVIDTTGEDVVEASPATDDQRPQKLKRRNFNLYSGNADNAKDDDE